MVKGLSTFNEYKFPFPLSPAKLIGDFCTYWQCPANGRCASPVFLRCDTEGDGEGDGDGEGLDIDCRGKMEI